MRWKSASIRAPNGSRCTTRCGAIERDFFYDPGLHGLDLGASRKNTSPTSTNIAEPRRPELSVREMLGEMTVGHMFVGGGDRPGSRRSVKAGLLGADYKVENGRYRFARVYNGENWNPKLQAPLTQPGVNVKRASTC